MSNYYVELAINGGDVFRAVYVPDVKNSREAEAVALAEFVRPGETGSFFLSRKLKDSDPLVIAAETGSESDIRAALDRKVDRVMTGTGN